MNEPACLTAEQVAVLDDLTREMRPELLRHGVDVRLWGLSHDGTFYRILYRGMAPTEELVQPFMLFGTDKVRFVFGQVHMLLREDRG